MARQYIKRDSKRIGIIKGHVLDPNFMNRRPFMWELLSNTCSLGRNSGFQQIPCIYLNIEIVTPKGKLQKSRDKYTGANIDKVKANFRKLYNELFHDGNFVVTEYLLP